MGVRSNKNEGWFREVRFNEVVGQSPAPPHRRQVGGGTKKVRLTDEVPTIEPHFDLKNRKRGLACLQPLHKELKIGGWYKKVRVVQSGTNVVQTIEPHFDPKIEKGGRACLQPLHSELGIGGWYKKSGTGTIRYEQGTND